MTKCLVCDKDCDDDLVILPCHHDLCIDCYADIKLEYDDINKKWYKRCFYCEQRLPFSKEEENKSNEFKEIMIEISNSVDEDDSCKCPICYDCLDVIKFSCNHEFCYNCYCRLDYKLCPFCRQQLPDLNLVGSIYTEEVVEIEEVDEIDQYYRCDCYEILRALLILMHGAFITIELIIGIFSATKLSDNYCTSFISFPTWLIVDSSMYMIWILLLIGGQYTVQFLNLLFITFINREIYNDDILYLRSFYKFTQVVVWTILGAITLWKYNILDYNKCYIDSLNLYDYFTFVIVIRILISYNFLRIKIDEIFR